MVEAGLKPRACTQSPETVLGGPSRAQEVQGALWVGHSLEEGLMEPGLQVAGVAQRCSHGFPSALQSTPGSGSVVVAAAHQGQVAAGSLAGCHPVGSTYCVQGEGVLRLLFRRRLGLRGVPGPPRPVSPGCTAFAFSPQK